MTDGVPQAMDGALGGFAQMRLELGECLLDRVEVGAVEPAPAEAGGGRNRSVAPTLSMAARTVGALWLDRLSMMTTSPRSSSVTMTRVT